MGIFNKDFNCINLDDNNFDENDSGIIIHVRNLAWYTKFEKHKAHKKDLNVVWHPNRWWDWCVSDEKKEIDPMVFEEL